MAVYQPLEGLHHLAQQTLQVEDFLHQEAFHRRLLPAGGVNALSRLPPHQDFMLEFWTQTGGDTHTHTCLARALGEAGAAWRQGGVI